MQAPEIRKFEVIPGIRSGTETFYSLRVHPRSGRPLTVACCLEKQDAQWPGSELERNIGLGKQPDPR
jgi:hypothetical protein